ncbi:glucokinase [Enterobacter cancerogenus]|uniref:Glucokinase n=1 Tax=Enterobacter cancerogenus TaxID=69218 RepID=A0A484Z7Q6_9ENTR|nr:glucokinase [Enterobacter cancerogenus]
MTKYALVGDVGGTNARLALCDINTGEITQAKTYSGLDYPSLEAVVRVYLDEHNVQVEDGCIAIACPITGDWVAMTNHTWAFSIAEMQKNLGFAHLEIINDFTAVSMAIPMLKPDHLIQFGGTAPVEGKPIAVYGRAPGWGWLTWCMWINVGLACRAKAVTWISRLTVRKRELSLKSCGRKLGTSRQSACSPGQAS